MSSREDKKSKKQANEEAQTDLMGGERPPVDGDADANNNSRSAYDMEGGPLAEGAEPRRVKYATPFAFHGSDHVEAGRIYRLAEKSDFLTFRAFADTLDGFTLCYNKDEIIAWQKKLPGEPMHVIKVFGVFHGCSPREMYDMLQDSVFREDWDEFRQEAFRIVKMNAHNDIGYYAARSPAALVANRDFVNQRQWFDTGREEYIIFNTSVPHAKVPRDYQKTVQKNKHGTYVRAISKLTGYLIQPWLNEQTGKPDGCCLTYVTQTDPCGWIPTALSNYVTTKYAPKTITKVREAMKKFKVWFPQQLANGRYEKDWDEGVEVSWWQTDEEEGRSPTLCITRDFARQTWLEERQKATGKSVKRKRLATAMQSGKPHRRPHRTPEEMRLFVLRTALLHEHLTAAQAPLETPLPACTSSAHGSAFDSATRTTASAPSSLAGAGGEPTLVDPPPMTRAGTARLGKDSGNGGGGDGGNGGVRAYRRELRAREAAWRAWASEPACATHAATAPLSAPGVSADGRPRVEGAARVHVGVGAGGGAVPASVPGSERVWMPHPATRPHQALARPHPNHLRLRLSSAPGATSAVGGGASGLTSASPVASAAAVVASPGGAVANRLVTLTAELSAGHEGRCRRQRQRLQQLRPDPWYRALPSYASLDGTPQLMDSDLNLSLSRVARCICDSGAVVV